MDINKAIRFIPEDPRWISKVLIGVLVTLASIFIIPAFFLSGYLIKIIRQVMNGQWDGLPEWDDWGDMFRDGFFVTIAQLVYSLPFILLILIGGLATGGFASMAGSEDAAGLIASSGFLVLSCLVILYSIFLLFLTPAIMIQYAIKDDFGACFRFGELMDIIRNHLSDILIAFVVSLGASLLVSAVISILSLIPCLGWIAAFVIGLAVGPVVSFVTAHLYGQIAAKVLGNKAGGTMTYG